MTAWINAPISGTCCACRPTVCDTCSCPAPTLVCDSISASLTKCGFDEFGTPSSPPKIYLGKTQNGLLVDSTTIPGYSYLNQWSGSFLYNSDCSTSTDTRQLLVEIFGGCFASATVTGPGGEIDGEYSVGNYNGLAFWSVDCAGSGVGVLYTCSGPTVSSSTVMLYMQSGCAAASGSDVRITLNNEYTTSDLISNTIAALPSYPNTFSGTCSSYRNLSSDEITYTIQRFKYKFVLPTMTGITTYAINWNEGSTAKSYTWNGTDTETPVYGPVLEPSSNGSVGITSVVITCT